MTKKLLAIAIGLTMIFSAGTALADYTTGTADYSVTITAGCVVDTSAMGLDFGSYFVGDPNLVNTAAGTVTITCANLLPYAWGINEGINPGGGQGPRLHDGSGNYITYDFYEGGTPLGDVGLTAIDATYTESYTTWTDRDATGTGIAQNYPLTADVNINAATVAGTYQDTITVTVAWP